MKKLKKWFENWFRRTFRKLILEICRDEVNRMTTNAKAEIYKEVAALAALDVEFQGSGKLIIVSRMNNRDIVKIIDIRSHYSLTNWRRICEDLERQYGIRHRVVDAPTPFLAEALADDSRRRNRF